jgi:hypothetical protein
MKKIISISQILITVFLLSTILYLYDFDKIFLYINKIDVKFLILFTFLGFLSIFIACIRFRLILQFLKYDYEFKNIVKNVFLGSFINQTPLTIIGGDISRMISLKNKGIKLTSGFVAVSLDRLLGMFSLLLLTSVLLHNFSQILENAVLFNMILLVVLIGWIGLVFLTLFKIFNINIKKINFINQLSVSLINIIKSPIILVKIVILSLLLNFLTILLVYLICFSIEINISLLNCLYIVPITMYFSLLPLSIGGWGVREGMFVITFGALLIGVEQSLAVSIVLGSLNLFIALPGAFMLKSLFFNK